MATRLIVNADDFGLTRGINRAIAELHQAGALTSATLMANGPAFDDAVAIARANPSLGVGCHIVLTDGAPICPPGTIPTLCPNGHAFRTSLVAFARDLLLHRVDPADIQREALAQLSKIVRAGVNPTHFDTHKHTHIFPRVASQLATILRRTSFMNIRNPFEPDFARRAAHAPITRRLQINILDRFKPAYQRVTAGVPTTEGTLGIAATGSLNAVSLQAILDALPDAGTFELLCHPGHNDADLDRITTRLRHHRNIEYRALLTQIPALSLQPNRPQLIHYGDL